MLLDLAPIIVWNLNHKPILKAFFEKINFEIASSQDADKGLELRDGYLRVFKGSVQRIIGNGFGQGGQLVDYFGPNVGPDNAGKSNAIIWMDTAGNAAFGGTVTAQNIVGQFQNGGQVNWSGSVDLIQSRPPGQKPVPYSSYLPVTTLTVPAPVNAGELHTPYISLMVTLSHRTGCVFVRFEEKFGSDWVQRFERQGVIFSNMNHSERGYVYEQMIPVVFVAAATSVSKQFRISVKCEAAAYEYNASSGITSYPPTKVIAINGVAYGIR